MRQLVDRLARNGVAVAADTAFQGSKRSCPELAQVSMPVSPRHTLTSYLSFLACFASYLP